MKRRNVRCIPGLQLRQQGDLLLDILNFVVVLVEIKRFDGHDLFGLVMNSSLLPSSAFPPFKHPRAHPFCGGGWRHRERKKTLSPLVDTAEASFADEFQHGVRDVWRDTGHLLPNGLIRVYSQSALALAPPAPNPGELDFRAPAGPSLRP